MKALPKKFIALIILVVLLSPFVAVTFGVSAQSPLPYNINFEVVSTSPFGATVRVILAESIPNVQMVVLNLEDIRNGIPANLARQQEIKYTEVNHVEIKDFEVKTPIMGERDITINDVIAVATPFQMPSEIEPTVNYSKETTDYLTAVKVTNTTEDAKGDEVLTAAVIGKTALDDTFKDAPLEVKTELDKILAELPDTITDVVDYDVRIVQQEVKTEIVKNESPTLEQIFSVAEPMVLEATVTSGGFYDGKKWGSTGVLALIIDGQYYYDMSHTSWWSTAYAHRIAITIDADNVDADLTNFPVYLNISNSSGITNADVTAIFDELGANSLKIVVANSDSTAQFYTEVVSWDSVGEVAELWTKVTAIDDLVDTTLNLYYDATQADNSTYVGATNSAAADSVWDANFLGVYHMNDGANTSSVYDSTTNDKDGTKTAANEPIAADGLAPGKAQNFDGSNDSISLGSGNFPFTKTTPFSVDAYINYDTTTGGMIVTNWVINTSPGWQFHVNAGKINMGLHSANGATARNRQADATTDTNDHYVSGTYDGSDTAAGLILYEDGAVKASSVVKDTDPGALADTFMQIGSRGAFPAPFDGLISEIRISNIARSTSYIKLTNYSLTDAAVTFGAEETFVPEPPTNVSATDGTYTDKVVVTWTKSVGATGYTVYRDTVDISGLLGDVATYDDTTADPPTITAGNANATDGTFTTKVVISLAGESISAGTVASYVVVATGAGGDSSDSSANDGNRGAGVLNYQVQRSSGDADADYANLGGATTDPYDDTSAPDADPATGVGQGRYWRYVLSSTDAVTQTSTANRGWKALGLPSAPTDFILTQIGGQTVQLDWTKGTLANMTIIRAKENGIPTSITDGWEVYNGALDTDTEVDLNLSGANYGFSAWSVNTVGNSSDYAIASIGGDTMIWIFFGILSLGLTLVSVRSSYWILKFIAGVSWFAVAAFWNFNKPSYITSGSATDNIVLMLLIGAGVAMFLMPMWSSRTENGQEVGRGFRIPFMKSEEDEPKPYTPNRAERNSDYANRVNNALAGNRIPRRR